MRTITDLNANGCGIRRGLFFLKDTMAQKKSQPKMDGPAPGFSRITEYEIDPRSIFGATCAERRRHRKPVMVKHHDTKLSWTVLDVHDPELYDSPILQNALRDVLIGLDTIGIMIGSERQQRQSLADFVKQLVEAVDKTCEHFGVYDAQLPADEI